MAHQQRSQLNKVLKENVMNYILEFVRNEREIAILFDKDLHNGQRKTIHRIVEEIRKLGEYGDQSRMDEGFDRLSLLYIAKHNRYVLQTQSEGDPPYRYLCLFKEAPKSMYLITHFKLNDKENDFLVKEETVQHRTSRKARKERRKDRWLVRNQRNINAKRSDDREYKIDKDSFGNTVRKIIDNGEDHDQHEKDSESESDNFGSDDENNSEIEGDKDCESENEINKPDEIMSENDNGVINFNEITKTTENNKMIGTEEEKMGIVERTTSEACRITKTDEILESDVVRPEIDKNTLESRDFKTGEPTIENNNESFKSKEESQPKIIEQKIDEVPNDDKAVNISILSSSRKEFMRYNLNMCFSDFLANDLFKEFKFLGEFDVEEFEVLNEFLRDFFLAKKGKSALDEEFMGIWSKAKSKLAFKRDLNGGIVIYKAS
ncbi:hypothetical protein ABMA28_011142 [Loxostege sticticalis]|uniref:R3H domain-containing protein n=1 Tax=Loxostege sticticalis TaxID=481309 RepID=A0ABD0S6A8_LOXSC